MCCGSVCREPDSTVLSAAASSYGARNALFTPSGVRFLWLSEDINSGLYMKKITNAHF